MIQKSQIQKWAAAFAAAACLAVPAGAETVRKLGFVNVDRIHRESVQAQNIQNKLDTEFAPRQRQLEKLQNEIEVSAQKAEKLKAGKARAAAMAECCICSVVSLPKRPAA